MLILNLQTPPPAALCEEIRKSLQTCEEASWLKPEERPPLLDSQSEEVTTRPSLPESTRLLQIKILPQPARKIYQSGLDLIGDEDWDAALLHMEALVRQHPKSNLADNAVFWMAKLYEHKKEKVLAVAEYHRLIENYPKSEKFSRASKRLKELESFQNH